MSKMTEYLEASVGYDSDGLPASSTQITFGFSPFSVAEGDNLDDVTQISAICKTDAIVGIKILDDMAMVTFDFSMETNTLSEFATELENYLEQRDHVTESLNRLRSELALAERNEDVKAIEDLEYQIRTMSIPFMLPAILPVHYGGTVQVSFFDDPKFVFFTSNHLNEVPYVVTMIYDAHVLFCQDEVNIYQEDTEAEIEAQQEELWYMQEAKRMEEEAYQAQYGSQTDYYSETEPEVDRRLKGVRVK